jgi:hypothetical protein
MAHFNGLVAGIAAMLAAVISLLTYLDDSGKLANPVGSAVIQVIGDDAGAGTSTTSTSSTTDTTERQGPAVESLTVDADGCELTVDWVVAGDSEGSLELFLNGEFVDQLPVESNSTDESVLDIFGEGEYEAQYELVAYDSDDRETDRASAGDSDVCIG